ncbi:MAG: HPr family phosphocarrier protein [Pseudomonadota bacterium]|nr:HPr family phosphocarrier protein [Pseudomonadota bacterium]
MSVIFLADGHVASLRPGGGQEAEVRVTRDDQTVDALSIMGLMMLAAGPGATIAISAEGRQAAEAVAALSRLVENRFEEER